jgi:hypothetical protein
MRAAEYAVRSHPEAELTVFHFDRAEGGGGTVEQNVERWVGQFEQPDGRPSREAARVERATVAGIAVTTVDVRGTFVGMRGMGGPGTPREGWRMLGAIAEGPRGMVFFKLTGPEAAVDESEGGFRALVESVRRAD